LVRSGPMSQAEVFEPTVLRGSPERLTDHMEQFQLGYLHAVVAAAGCVVVGKPAIDEGVDMEVSHRSAQHGREGVARLEIQLKATSQGKNTDGSISVTLAKDRYDYYRHPSPTMDKIVVVLAMPPEPDNWLSSTPEALLLRHCAYWVNLAGAESVDVAEPTVRAPGLQVFDDLQLCQIMQRIGQGGAP
jgi:Domain of unknown function (DUF4365)